MDNPKRIDFNNPRIDFKGTSFDKYVISKPINHFSIIITRLSPIFKPWKNQDVSEIKFEGCLLKYPVCELPKFGLLKKFYSILQNHFTLSIHTTKKNEEIDLWNLLHRSRRGTHKPEVSGSIPLPATKVNR